VRVVTESEFASRLRLSLDGTDEFGAVTGPGRSGAIAAAYASHLLGVPFVPFGQPAPKDRGRLLIIDTAEMSGATLRKARRRYAEHDAVTLAVFREPPRVRFWYERASQ
jgi:hypothetical protein